LRLLQQFAEKEADLPARLGRALAAQDYDAAGRIAHSLKGVAGNIGFRALHAEAAALETAIRAGDGIEPALTALEASLTAIIASLRSAFADGTSSADAGDTAASSQHLARLARLLSDADGDAVGYLMQHGPAVRSALPGEAYASLEKAVSDFDFEEALRTLEGALP